MTPSDPHDTDRLPDDGQASGSQAQTAAHVVGVAGGGQLARMMFPAAAVLDLKLVVLDPDAQCSSAAVALRTIVGPFDSAACLRQLAESSDFVTFEIERINAEALAELEAEGYLVRPGAKVLQTIQDKLVQKKFLRDHGIPTSSFTPFDPQNTAAPKFPCVWKACRDGYDGRGVAIVQDATALAALPPVAALLEERVAIELELAILIARDAHGETVTYPLTEIVMDPQDHIMDSVIAPAEVSDSIARQCQDIAEALATALGYIGILAIEFFVDTDGQVLVNEMSPRPHNSGHYTIEACATSQFEQHLRAVTGAGLTNGDLLSAAVTFNVLGAQGASGKPHYVGFDGWSESDRVYVHSYDKPEVRPGRKMGHVTVLAENRAAAIEKAQRIKGSIQVVSVDE